jgi:two-component system, cell cycle response regulator
MGISYKVFIIDDEKMMRNLLVSLFFKHGHNCETAQDGIEALEIIKKNSFDVAVIDIVMAPMDGITLTKELAKLSPNLPIMIMTGYADEHSAKLAIEAGAQEFIKKPFSIDEFIIRFDKMMRHHMGEKELLALSLTDELTGLYNRRRFFVLTEQYLKVVHRTRKRSLLLYIDIDDLKWINDHFGHHEGDQALINFATILKKTFRESDIIARIGGDEFVVLLESNDENDEILITHLYKNIKDNNATGFHHYSLSISLGVSEFDPRTPSSLDELLSKADALMYAQKRRRWKDQSQIRI